MFENGLSIVVVFFATALTYVVFRALRVWCADDLGKRNLAFFWFLLGVCIIGGTTIFFLHWRGYESMKQPHALQDQAR